MKLTKEDRKLFGYYSGLLAGMLLVNDLQEKLNVRPFAEKYDDIINAIVDGEEIEYIENE